MGRRRALGSSRRTATPTTCLCTTATLVAAGCVAVREERTSTSTSRSPPGRGCRLLSRDTQATAAKATEVCRIDRSDGGVAFDDDEELDALFDEFFPEEIPAA